MKKLTTEEFIERSKNLHNNKYDYSISIYNGSSNPIDIICPIHGKFTLTRAGRHLEGCGCPTCGKINGGKSKKDLSKTFKKREEEFIKKAKILNPEYNYSKVKYSGENNNVIIICPKHGEFMQTPHNHIGNNNKCPKCSCIGISSQEKDIVNFIKTIYGKEIIENDRKILNGKELDIYIPELRLAIEYDGLYWHNNINNSYKFEECKKKNIRLIQITELEWKKKNNKIKQYLTDLLLNNCKKIYAKECIIKELSNEEYKNFIEEYSLKDYINTSIKIGLFYNDELIQVMSFDWYRFSRFPKDYEIIQECSKFKFSIVGGKSKILKYFERKYNPNKIYGICEKNKFSGNSFIKCGFKLFEEWASGYSLINNYKIFNYGKYVYIKENV